MRVLHITHMVEKDGSSISLLDILDAEKERGDVLLVTVQSPYGFLVDELKKRLIPYRVIRFRFNCYPPIRKPLDFVFFLYRLLRDRVVNEVAFLRMQCACREFKPDVIHTNNGITNLGYLVAKKFRIKHVWHIRECQGTRYGCMPFPSMAALQREINDSISTKICVSSFVKEAFGLSDNSCVIYDGVRHRWSISLKQGETGNYFLFVGQATPAKGLDDVISAYLLFSQQGGEEDVLIAGETPRGYDDFVRQQQNRVKKANLERKVIFLGLRNDVDELLRHAKAVIVASRYEGFGRVAPEAMLNGCFVIGRNSTGTAEVLHKINVGILFEDVHQLASAMIKVSKMNGEELVDCCRVAQQRAVKLFTIEESTESFLRVYED